MREQKEIISNQDHNYLKPKAPYAPPEERKVELFATIKKSSEYYHQGLDQNNKPLIFKIESICPGFLCFRLNFNNYSSNDLAFYVKDTKGNLIPLAGGMSR
jgi:hypothetical protein